MGNENAQVNVSVSENLVKPILEAKIEALLIESLGGAEKLMGELVYKALMQKCNKEGKVENYDSYNTTTYLEFVCTKMLKEVAQSAINKFVESKKPVLEKQIAEHFKKSTNNMAKLIMEGFEKCVKDSWRLQCDFTMQTPGK